MVEIISPENIAEHIKDGSTVAVSGFVGCGCPEELLCALENAYLKNGLPKDLTVVYAAGQGDGKDRGINHLAHEGLIKRVIGGHWGLAPKMAKLAVDNRIEGYNFPQGIITSLYRDIAAKKPGTISSVGMHTFVDPRLSGAKANAKTKQDLVEVIELGGKEWLFYQAFPINVALIRGTSSDMSGNISVEREANLIDTLAIAQAAHNCGGVVIAQVERIVENKTLKPWMVKVPGILVDFVVVSKPGNHWQTFGREYDPALSGEIRMPLEMIPPMLLDERKVISRRAFKEIKDGYVVNLGIGLPEGISSVASEKGLFDSMHLSIESGITGGLPAGGLNFGTSYNPDSIIDQPSQFDFYDGGGLDIAFLGMAQADRFGNVNVSKFNNRLVGCGGFINISQNTKRVVFCGTFNSGELEVQISNGKLKILNEGKHKKFVGSVEQVTFSGDYAMLKQQDVLYITERAVFKLTDMGLTLTETAPGIDVKKQIIEQMGFEPVIAPDLKLMDKDIFID
jgi:propionate CoA-transferase